MQLKYCCSFCYFFLELGIAMRWSLVSSTAKWETLWKRIKILSWQPWPIFWHVSEDFLDPPPNRADNSSGAWGIPGNPTELSKMLPYVKSNTFALFMILFFNVAIAYGAISTTIVECSTELSWLCAQPLSTIHTSTPVITIMCGGFSASLPCFMEWKDIRIQTHVIDLFVMRWGADMCLFIYPWTSWLVIFIYLFRLGLWLCKGFSCCGEYGPLSSCGVKTSCRGTTGSRCTGFSSCGTGA